MDKCKMIMAEVEKSKEECGVDDKSFEAVAWEWKGAQKVIQESNELISMLECEIVELMEAGDEASVKRVEGQMAMLRQRISTQKDLLVKAENKMKLMKIVVEEIYYKVAQPEIEKIAAYGRAIKEYEEELKRNKPKVDLKFLDLQLKQYLNEKKEKGYDMTRECNKPKHPSWSNGGASEGEGGNGRSGIRKVEKEYFKSGRGYLF